MGQTTITIRDETKDLLSILKGGKTWDEFLQEVADEYPRQEAIEALQKRLDDLRAGKVKGVPLRDVKIKTHRKRRGR